MISIVAGCLANHDRAHILVVGVALSLYELRMLVDRRRVLGESVALNLQELRMLSPAKARGRTGGKADAIILQVHH